MLCNISLLVEWGICGLGLANQLFAFTFRVHSLQNNLDKQAIEFRALLEKNVKFRQRLFEVMPVEDALLKDASLMMMTGGVSHTDSRIFVGDEDMDGVIVQVEKLKNYINKLELQIYEMNEKVAELIENVRESLRTP